MVEASDWGFTEFRVGVKARATSSRFPDGYDITADNPIQFTETFSSINNLQDYLGNTQQRLVFNGDELEYVTTEALHKDGLENIIEFLYLVCSK